jgi:hypothetical protein
MLTKLIFVGQRVKIGFVKSVAHGLFVVLLTLTVNEQYARLPFASVAE